jgi:hypothetical protein
VAQAPLGKLDTERMVPIDEYIVAMIDQSLRPVPLPGDRSHTHVPAVPRTSHSPATVTELARTGSAKNSSGP